MNLQRNLRATLRPYFQYIFFNRNPPMSPGQAMCAMNVAYLMAETLQEEKRAKMTPEEAGQWLDDFIKEKGL